MPNDANVAVITGAGSGIGKACAIRFAREGYRIVAVDWSETAGQETTKLLRSRDVEAVFCCVDVSKENACAAFAQAGLEAFGRIDVLVANAGIRAFGTVLETTEEDWDRILSVNLKGVHFSCKAVLPAMIEQRSGAMVLIGSTGAMTGRPDMPIYDAAKFGVLSLTRTLAATYSRYGIRVNAVCPAKTLTEFHINRAKSQGISEEVFRKQFEEFGLLGRAAEPEEIAAAIYFMASTDASFITGQYLMVDGGQSVSVKPFT